jgi:hypothetical protein
MDRMHETAWGALYNAEIDLWLDEHGDEYDGQVQLLFTGPPYMVGSNGPLDARSVYYSWLVARFNRLKRLLKDDGSMVVVLGSHWVEQYQKPYTLNALQALCNVLPLCQMFPVIHKNPITSPSVAGAVNDLVFNEERCADVVEHAWWFGRNPKARCLGDNVIYATPTVLDVDELRSMPRMVPAMFITMLTDEDDIVMDPFAGTGSTLVAAEAMRRNWIGVEKDELTTRFAATRLKD